MFQYPSSIILRERTHSNDVKDMKDAMSAVSVLYEQTLPKYVPCDEAWVMISIGNTHPWSICSPVLKAYAIRRSSLESVLHSSAFSNRESSRNWIADLELNPVRRWRKTYIKELVVVTSAVIWMTEPAVMSHFKAPERVPLCWVSSFGYSENYTYRKLKQLQENLRFEPKGTSSKMHRRKVRRDIQTV